MMLKIDLQQLDKLLEQAWLERLRSAVKLELLLAVAFADKQ